MNLAVCGHARLPAAGNERNVFGPRPGYLHQIGALILEMTWMR